jgi:hypothetical protein
MGQGGGGYALYSAGSPWLGTPFGGADGAIGGVGLTPATAAINNTGGGGGGYAQQGNMAASGGGSGVVIVKWEL